MSISACRSLHDCLRLSHCKEGIEAAFAGFGVSHESADDYGSNRVRGARLAISRRFSFAIAAARTVQSLRPNSTAAGSFPLYPLASAPDDELGELGEVTGALGEGHGFQRQ